MRKGRGHRGVKRDIAFHLLHDLVDVSIQHGDRAKAFEQPKRLRAIFGAPAPIRIDRPKRYVRKNHHRPAGRLGLEIRFEPLELIRAELTKAFKRRHIGQPDEMDVLVVEAEPTASLAVLAITRQVFFTVVDRRR